MAGPPYSPPTSSQSQFLRIFSLLKSEGNNTMRPTNCAHFPLFVMRLDGRFPSSNTLFRSSHLLFMRMIGSRRRFISTGKRKNKEIYLSLTALLYSTHSQTHSLFLICSSRETLSDICCFYSCVFSYFFARMLSLANSRFVLDTSCASSWDNATCSFRSTDYPKVRISPHVCAHMYVNAPRVCRSFQSSIDVSIFALPSTGSRTKNSPRHRSGKFPCVPVTGPPQQRHTGS